VRQPSVRELREPWARGMPLAEFDLHFTKRPAFTLPVGPPASFSHYVGGLPTDARGFVRREPPWFF
jgi:hypothetical protein